VQVALCCASLCMAAAHVSCGVGGYFLIADILLPSAADFRFHHVQGRISHAVARAVVVCCAHASFGPLLNAAMYCWLY
jgi:hypothetical protein